MKALSIRQPWAWAILHAGKRIENRDWRGCSYRGPLLIHAAKGCGVSEYEDASAAVCFIARTTRITVEVPPLDILQRGGIVGVCTLVDVIDRGAYISRAFPSDPAERIESLWYAGALGLVLRDVRPLPFVPFKGALGFFDVPESLVDLGRETKDGAR